MKDSFLEIVCCFCWSCGKRGRAQPVHAFHRTSRTTRGPGAGTTLERWAQARSGALGDKKGHEALNFAKDKVREVFGGTNRGTVMRRRPTVNCRPSDTPARNPVPRDFAITILLVSAKGLTGQR
jgi:hypothetical protein